MWRRFTVFGITTALLAAAIAVTPMAGIASWACAYMLYASLFTGPPMLPCVAGQQGDDRHPAQLLVPVSSTRGGPRSRAGRSTW